MADTASLGIDIAKRKFDVALVRRDGKVRVKACPNTPAGYTELVAWVARQHDGAVHASRSHGHVRGRAGRGAR